jgi:Na+/glutamate symporter
LAIGLLCTKLTVIRFLRYLFACKKDLLMIIFTTENKLLMQLQDSRQGGVCLSVLMIFARIIMILQRNPLSLPGLAKKLACLSKVELGLFY